MQNAPTTLTEDDATALVDSMTDIRVFAAHCEEQSEADNLERVLEVGEFEYPEDY